MKLKDLLNESTVTEDTLRQAMAESGKTKATDLKNYIKIRFPNHGFSPKEITAIVKDFRDTL